MDSHSHLNSSGHPVTVTDTVFVVSTGPRDWDRVLCVENVYQAIGIHPYYLTDFSHEWIDDLRKKLEQLPQVGVGEIGIDKLQPNLDLQLSVFRLQFQLAHLYHRTVSIHCVRAHSTLIEELKMLPSVPCIKLHSWSGNAEQTHQILKLKQHRFYFGFSLHINKNLKKLRQLLSFIPPESLLIESDLFLYDPKRTSSIKMMTVICADILNIEVEVLEELLLENFKRMIQTSN